MKSTFAIMNITWFIIYSVYHATSTNCHNSLHNTLVAYVKEVKPIKMYNVTIKIFKIVTTCFGFTRPSSGNIYMRLFISLHTFLKSSFRRGLLLFSYIFSCSAAIFYVYLVRSCTYRVLCSLSYCAHSYIGNQSVVE
jgi:hypothetical protein